METRDQGRLSCVGTTTLRHGTHTNEDSALPWDQGSMIEEPTMRAQGYESWGKT